MPKTALVFLAGLIWAAVGLMLDGMAYSWLKEETPSEAALCAGAGLVLALVIHHFGFLRIVDRNLRRIQPMEGRRCLFSFIPWKSYLLIPIMIALGFLLRQSGLPRPALAVLYSGIGTALLLSGIRYVRHLIAALRA
ncbi:MAG: hypothetical protein ACOWWM_20430 [Desulfobacterales bacterium]